METKQQAQTLEYFSKCADDWARKGRAVSRGEVNVIKQRNNFVLKVINEREKTNSLLDVGCGTGDLVCEVASKGIDAVGVDFAKEMIDNARANAEDLRGGKATFVNCSIFDYPFQQSQFDVISANGFIEYISHEELVRFFNLAVRAMKPGGSLILGSRNRLFNLFSLNNFTQDEMSEGCIDLLICEALQIVKTEDVKDLIGFKTAPLQRGEKEHEDTGVKVSTRYQFTPAQLIGMLYEYGLYPVEMHPINIHGVLPKFKSKEPLVYADIANFLMEYAEQNPCMIPQASSFMIHSRKG